MAHVVLIMPFPSWPPYTIGFFPTNIRANLLDGNISYPAVYIKIKNFIVYGGVIIFGGIDLLQQRPEKFRPIMQ
jgi:hypothetical protein